MFIYYAGERFNVLLQGDMGAWVISYDSYHMPVFLEREHLDKAERIQTPDEYVANKKRELSEAQKDRQKMMGSVLNDVRYITDKKFRQAEFRRIAKENDTTVKRISRLFYLYLSHGCLVQGKPRETKRIKEFDDAIKKYYFSAKKLSLQFTYDMFILENHMTDGKVDPDAPTWSAFHSYYYRHWHNKPEKSISREGLTNYQRNERPLYGSAMQYRDRIGCYQIDETPGDIYLVSKFDKSKVIGRPIVYMAIDTATGVIAGIHIGLDSGEEAAAACLANAVCDKVVYCKQMGINIKPEDWPSSGMPYEIISDRGNEFLGKRMEEFCTVYGIDIQSLPPFRADEKPLIERAFGMIQDLYKPSLRGKGIIGSDVNERWATDYRRQAILTLDDYTRIVINCIITLNRSRILGNVGHLPEDAPNTPNALWAWLTERGKNGTLTVEENEVRYRSLPRDSATITRKGLYFNGMRYLPKPGVQLPIGENVEFAYDKANVSTIVW